jgi:hypothetical protein
MDKYEIIAEKSKALGQKIDNYTSPEDIHDILKLANDISYHLEREFSFHTVKDYIQDKNGNNTTLFYKLFFDNFNVANEILYFTKNGNAPDLFKYLNTLKGYDQITEHQNVYEVLFDNLDYATTAELNVKAYFSKFYLDDVIKLKSSRVENYKLVDGKINEMLDNVQAPLKAIVQATCQELEKANNFEELKTILHNYLDDSNVANMPNTIREMIVWLKPVFHSLKLELSKNFSNFDNYKNGKNPKQLEHFLEEIVQSKNEILLNEDNRNALIDYAVSFSMNEQMEPQFNMFMRKSLLIGSLLSMIEIDQFGTKFMENHILNEKEKLEASIIYEENYKKVKNKI